MNTAIDSIRALLNSESMCSVLCSPTVKGLASDYGKLVASSALKQFTDYEDDIKHGGLRLSSLGKPAVLQAIELTAVRDELIECGVYQEEEGASSRLRELFHRGDQYEALVMFVLQLYGYKVISTQETVSFMGVPGHTDAIIETPFGDQLLLEVKTMSDYYFKQFVKCQNDDRGYITQLATYAYCTSKTPVWICLNKGNHEVAVIEPVPEQLDRALTRARVIIPILTDKISCVDDILANLKAPPGVEEVYRKHKTDKFLLAPSIKYSPYRSMFYELVTEPNGYGKDTEYILNVR